MALDLDPPPSVAKLWDWKWIEWLNRLYEYVKANMTTNFALEVAKGNIAGHASVQKFGRNQDIASGAQEDIWDGGATWVAPTQARIHQIVSTSTSDDGAPVGVGARTIQVYGLTSWATKEVSEVIIMNGTTNVPTTNSYVIIHRMKVLTKGASDVNVGVITATADTDGTVTARMEIGFGQSQMAIYGVPSIQKAYVFRFYSNVLKAAGTVEVDNLLLVNPEPDVELLNFIIKHTFANSNVSMNTQIHLALPKVFAGPCIIKMAAIPDANSTDVGGGFDAYIVDN